MKALPLLASGFEVLDCQYVGYSEMIFKARKPTNGTPTDQPAFQCHKGNNTIQWQDKW